MQLSSNRADFPGKQLIAENILVEIRAFAAAYERPVNQSWGNHQSDCKGTHIQYPGRIIPSATRGYFPGAYLCLAGPGCVIFRQDVVQVVKSDSLTKRGLTRETLR